MVEKRPTICFLIGGREGGGMAQSTLQLILGIDRNAFNINVATCETGPFSNRLLDAGQPCDPLKTNWPPMLRRSSGEKEKLVLSGYFLLPIWMLKSTLAVVRHIKKNQIDIIHTNYLHFHAIAFMACLFTRRKCVWHWRAPISKARSSFRHTIHRNPIKNFRWFLMKCLGLPIRMLSSRTAWSIANSQITSDHVRMFSGKKICVIYNGVSMNTLPSDRQKLRPLLGVDDNTRIVGMVGTLHPIKGHDYYLEAAEIVCNNDDRVHFVHIGGQTSAKQQQYEDRLKSKCSTLRLENRFHFLGHRTDAAILTADFDIATVCTLPPGEGFGLVIIEAMAHAIPVISTNIGAALEILEDGKTGILIDPARPIELADAIKQLLDDDKKRKIIGQAAQTICREKYDIKRTLDEVEDLYRIILGE